MREREREGEGEWERCERRRERDDGGDAEADEPTGRKKNWIVGQRLPVADHVAVLILSVLI